MPCLDRFGRVDVLHNNVGIVQPRPTAEVEEAEWDRVCAVNLKGMFPDLPRRPAGDGTQRVPRG